MILGILTSLNSSCSKDEPETPVYPSQTEVMDMLVDYLQRGKEPIHHFGEFFVRPADTDFETFRNSFEYMNDIMDYDLMWKVEVEGYAKAIFFRTTPMQTIPISANGGTIILSKENKMGKFEIFKTIPNTSASLEDWENGNADLVKVEQVDDNTFKIHFPPRDKESAMETSLLFRSENKLRAASDPSKRCYYMLPLHIIWFPAKENYDYRPEWLMKYYEIYSTEYFEP